MTTIWWKGFIHPELDDDRCHVSVSHYCAAHCNLSEK